MMPLFASGEKTTDPENPTPTSESEPRPGHRRPWTLKTTRDEVLETVRAHLGGDGPKPKFDDVCSYDISETQEDMLWEHEATRLMRAVGDMTRGLRFESYGKFQQGDCRSAYERLASLADQIMLNLHICILDNELVLWKAKEKLGDAKTRQLSEEILQTRLDNPKSAHKAAREDSEDVSEESFMERYFAMVDYLTAVVARFGVSAAEEGEWQRRVLAGLAKSSAKLKILARNTDTYAARSIDAIKRYRTEQQVMDSFNNTKTGLPEQGATRLGHHDMQDIGDGGWGPSVMPVMPVMNAAPLQHQEGKQSQYAKELELMVESQDDDSEDPYLSDMADAFSWVSSTLRSLVYCLMAGSPLDSFDISTVTYQAGTADTPFPVYMYQDRNGELHGSSDPDFIKHAYLGYVLAEQAVEEVRMEQHASVNQTPTQNATSSGTVVTFQMRKRYEDHNNDTVVELPPVNLTNLAQIIAVMIPVLLTSSEIISALRSSLSSLGGLLSIDVEEHLTPRSPSFTAMVSLRTKTFENNSPSCLPGAEFRSLSQSLLAHPDRQVSHSRIPSSTVAWSSIPADQVQHRLDEVQERRARLAADGQDWDIEEMAVRVKCGKYVYLVLGIAGFLVAGGLAAAFTIGDRVEGVDPFNIASFSWLLAGFIILIAKSIRVTEWPWRDFLLGRVTCRSLSELRAVTSANEQDLILYLLTKEPESVLITRGPYNRLFTRKEEQASAGGFSIDIKPEVRTLIAAGLIFAVVALRHGGTALVCLDLRRGSENRTSIAHTGDEQGTVCRYPPKPSDKEKLQDVMLNHLQLPVDKKVVWNRVLGFYHSPERKVR